MIIITAETAVIAPKCECKLKNLVESVCPTLRNNDPTNAAIMTVKITRAKKTVLSRFVFFTSRENKSFVCVQYPGVRSFFSTPSMVLLEKGPNPSLGLSGSPRIRKSSGKKPCSSSSSAGTLCATVLKRKSEN